MSKNNGLLKLEEKAKNLFEKSISRLLGGSTFQRELAKELVSQVESSQYGNSFCDRIWIYIAPDDMDALQETSSLEEDLSRFLTEYVLTEYVLTEYVLTEYAREAEVAPIGPISVTFILERHKSSETPLVVTGCSIKLAETTQALERTQALEKTQALKKIDNSASIGSISDIDAFLIDGANHIPLKGPSISIGRHLENDIVVNTKSVSRRHAIIRWQQGVFVIHDLGSKAGTRKNGVQIRESVLRPGDVIAIGERSYIYGEGLTPVERDSQVSPNSSGTTQSLNRPSL